MHFHVISPPIKWDEKDNRLLKMKIKDKTIFFINYILCSLQIYENMEKKDSFISIFRIFVFSYLAIWIFWEYLLSEDIISSKYSPLFKTETSIDSTYVEYKTSFPNKSITLK